MSPATATTDSKLKNFLRKFTVLRVKNRFV